mmetsp:Transcript_23399/g.71958  ORF Transcript_23399/g.71958 Transcript_23399/m.71958 type:complete len:642 (+) Transcript_23399:501-2426(+)
MVGTATTITSAIVTSVEKVRNTVDANDAKLEAKIDGEVTALHAKIKTNELVHTEALAVQGARLDEVEKIITDVRSTAISSHRLAEKALASSTALSPTIGTAPPATGITPSATGTAPPATGILPVPPPDPPDKSSLRNNPFISISKRSPNFKPEWCSSQDAVYDKEAQRPQNTVSVKTNPNMAVFLGDSTKHYSKLLNVEQQIDQFMNTLSVRGLPDVVRKYQSYNAYLMDNNSVSEKLAQFIAEYKKANPDYHSEGGAISEPFFDETQWFRTGVTCRQAIDNFMQKLLRNVKILPSRDVRSAQFNERSTYTRTEFRNADVQIFDWLQTWLRVSLVHDNPLTAEVMANLTSAPNSTFALIAFLAADNPSTNEHQLTILNTRFHSVRYTRDDIVFHFSHYISYLGELVRDLNKRLPPSKTPKTDHDIFAKLELEVRYAYQEYAKITLPAEMTTLQSHNALKVQDNIVNEGKATFAPAWGRDLLEMTKWFKEVETRLDTPQSPPDKWVHKWTPDHRDLEIPTNHHTGEEVNFFDDPYADQYFPPDDVADVYPQLMSQMLRMTQHSCLLLIWVLVHMIVKTCREVSLLLHATIVQALSPSLVTGTREINRDSLRYVNDAPTSSCNTLELSIWSQPLVPTWVTSTI